MTKKFNIDFKELSIDDIREILEQSGYEAPLKEFAFARVNDFYRYTGTVNNQVRYLMAFEDANNPNLLIVSGIYIGFERGRIRAEYSAMPLFESSEIDAISEYVKTQNG